MPTRIWFNTPDSKDRLDRNAADPSWAPKIAEMQGRPYSSATTVKEFMDIMEANLQLVGESLDCPNIHYCIVNQDLPIEQFTLDYWRDMMLPKSALLQYFRGIITEEYFLKHWPLIPDHRSGMRAEIEVMLRELGDQLPKHIYAMLADQLARMHPNAKEFFADNAEKIPQGLVLRVEHMGNSASPELAKTKTISRGFKKPPKQIFRFGE